MKISKNRIDWETLLGQWYTETPNGIFSSNSDIIQTTDTAISIPYSDEKASVRSQYVQSRVINISGLIVAKDIYECRKQEAEIKSKLTGEKIYFYDEYTSDNIGDNTGKVFYGFIPNINDSIGRGQYDGRTSLINFNVTLLSPFMYEYYKTEDINTTTGQSVIQIDNSLLDRQSQKTYFSVKVDFFSENIVTKIFDGKIEFYDPVTVKNGDYIYISSEDNSFIAYKDSAGTKNSILSNIKDSYFIDGYMLQNGLNSFTIPIELRNGCKITCSYYKRSL